jgi:hypothetical protein
MSDARDDAPVLRVVRGEPSEEELAALTALVTIAGGDGDEAAPPERGRWNDPARLFRRPLLPGPGAWRSSGW